MIEDFGMLKPATLGDIKIGKNTHPSHTNQPHRTHSTVYTQLIHLSLSK